MDYPDLYRVSPREAERASGMLAESFMGDPFFRYLFPDDVRRSKVLPHLFRTIVAWAMATGDVYATSVQFEGVMTLPWRRIPSFPARLRTMAHSLAAAGGLLFRYGLVGPMRRARGIRPATRTLIQFYRLYEPSIHIGLIAVQPQYRGRGFMTRMMRPVLAEADGTGSFVVLDTESEENIPLYRRFDFRLAHEIQAAPGLHYHLMVRTPHGLHDSTTRIR